MAIGSAYFFNIKLPINFNSPYLSVNIQDFWRRWHITLSRFLRDYIYIPLGGNKKGEARTYVNIMITFLIGGLWHGAAWTFVAWGAMHGGAAVIHRLWGKLPFRLPRVLAVLITFVFVNCAWVFFRCETFPEAVHVIKAMFGGAGFSGYSLCESIGITERVTSVFLASVAVIILFFTKNTNSIPDRFVPSGKSVLVLVCIVLVSMVFLNSTPPKEFLYFDF